MSALSLSALNPGQFGAVTGKRPRKLPIKEVILAELPAEKAKGEVEARMDLYNKEMEQAEQQHKESIASAEKISLRDLEQRREQNQSMLAQMERESQAAQRQKKEEMRLASEQAEKAQKIQKIGMGVQAGLGIADLLSDTEVGGQIVKSISSAAGGIFDSIGDFFSSLW